MPMPSFLNSLADKAQSAIQASPLAGHIPSSHNRPSSPDSAAQPPANEAAAQGGHRSHALESIQHTIRTFGQQYANTTPVQKIITTAKGAAIDFDSVSRDAKAHSKELYTWGQAEGDDLKDVSDRLAYLNFVHGSLASTLAVKLDNARAPFKAVRDAEAALAPRRNIRAGLEAQISKLEHDQQKAGDRKLTELREQLGRAYQEDSAEEKEIEILKRKALRESEKMKWEALREYGEKLSLIAQAAPSLVDALPSIPPTKQSPYAGTNATAATRGALQQALDGYRTGHVHLQPTKEGADLSRSDTRSFGETHATELSHLTTNPAAAVQSNLPLTPPAAATNLPAQPQPQPQPQQPQPQAQQAQPQQTQPRTASGGVHSPPINPAQLNQSPAAIPTSAIPPLADQPSTTSPVVPPTTSESSEPKLAPVQPTIAETGVPISGGGPKSGSLKDLRSSPPSSASPLSANATATPPSISQVTGAPAKYETAEEEKQRLAREERDRLLQSGGTAPPPAAQPKHETAEEEKKRLEREERERYLANASAPQKKDGDELPPYADI